MFILVENCNHDDIADRPDLGCARLVASCRKSGVQIDFISPQSIYINELFGIHGKLREQIESLSRGSNLLSELELQTIKSLIDGAERYEYLWNEYIEKKSAVSDLDLGFLVNGVRLAMTLAKQCAQKNTRVWFLEAVVDAILYKQPTMVGISLHADDCPSKYLRRRLNEAGIPIIVGGPLFTKKSKDQIKSFLELDPAYIVVKGLADEALPLLIEKKMPVHLIPGVHYLSGDLLMSGPQIVPLDPTLLPNPDYSIYSGTHLLRDIVPLQMGLGCTWRRCRFCTHHLVYEGTYRRRPAEMIVDDIIFLQKKYEINIISFNDGELVPTVVNAFCNELEKRKIYNLKFTGYGRLTPNFTHELLKKMSRVGFIQMNWGLESGSDRVLALTNKGTKVADASIILKNAAKVGIGNICWVMLGYPGETLSEAEETMLFLDQHSDYIDLSLIAEFIPETQAPVWSELEKEIKEGRYPEWDVASFHKRILVTEKLGLTRTCRYYDLPQLCTNHIRSISFTRRVREKND